MKEKRTEKNGLIRTLLNRFIIKMKLRNADSMWFLMGHNCFEPFPPSFYYGKTEEEIDQIFDEMIKKLYEIIDGCNGEPSEPDGSPAVKSEGDS